MKHHLLKMLLTFACLSLANVVVSAQGPLNVTGTVLDSQTGEPVIGAMVLEKGTQNAALVDMDGRYSINTSGDAVLVCKCLGYNDSEQSVGGRTTVSFSLVVDSQMLEETVVVGYGTLKKSQLVGSVESVSGEILEDRVTSNVTRSLQGQVAGLNIIQTDGKPTHGGNVYIRGGATSYISRGSKGGAKAEYSIGQGGGALVLVDGVESELSSVNPEDVESISVLKDASSSVIYGARAAYGVILVTTKNGSKEKINITYNGSVSVNSRTVKWEDGIVTDGLQFLENYYTFWSGADNTLPTKLNAYTYPSNYLELYREHAASGATNSYDIVDGKYAYYGNYNYISMFYKPVNTTTTHNLSVNGTSGKVSYGISGRYYGQDAIYKIGNEDYSNFNLRTKIKVQATDWLSFDNNTAIFKMGYLQPIFSKEDGNIGSQLRQIAMAGQPMVPVTHEDGTFSIGAAAGGYASFVSGNSAQDDGRFQFTTSTGLTIEPVKDVLKIRGEFYYKKLDRYMERYTAPIEYSKTPGKTEYYINQTSSYKRRYDYSTEHITANAILTWTPKLGDNHNLNVVGGWNLEDDLYERKGILRTGLLYPGKPNFELMDGEEVTLYEDGSSYGLVGFFARVNYSLLRRYIFEVSARYDGSSKFPVNQQWGFFPSASVGWRISEEPWMEGTRSWLDNLKLRANAGSLGNGGIAAYSFLTTLGVTKTTALFDGAPSSKVSDPATVPDNLTWEKVTTYDVGLDMDVLKSRLSFSGDYYVRNTTDLFITGPEIPAVYGDTTPKGNYGSLQTRGWELTLSWRDSFKLGGKDFNYSVKGSLWDSRTFVTKFYNESGGIFNLYEGKELGEIWGFRTNGLYVTEEEALACLNHTYHKFPINNQPHAGDLKFVDSNSDNTIGIGAWTLDDHGDLQRIGNETPRYQFGVNLDFNWNGIGLSAFIQGVGKRDWYPSKATDFFWGSYGRAYAYALKSQLSDMVVIDNTAATPTVTNPDAYWTRPARSVAETESGPLCFPNDHFLQNAAYVRLKNLTIDYTLPKNICAKIKMDKIRFYLSGENLFTFSPLFKHTQMFDPEVIGNGDTDFHSGTSDTMGDGYSYPLLRTITFGVNLTL